MSLTDSFVRMYYKDFTDETDIPKREKINPILKAIQGGAYEMEGLITVVGIFAFLLIISYIYIKINSDEN